MYGIDWDGPVSVHDDIPSVEVPEINNLLDEEQKQKLKETIDPVEVCDDAGLSLYFLTRAFCQCASQ